MSVLNKKIQSLRQQLSKLDQQPILIIGDVGVDEYVIGEVKRISPEAPVPVLEVQKEDMRLGLAANVAQNVASLGGKALLVSVVGEDSAAENLRMQLEAAQVSGQYLLGDSSRPTTRKLRVLAEHHHLVRVDYERKRFLSPEMETKLLAKVEELLPQCVGVIIEDYAKGVVSETCAQGIIQASHAQGKRVVIDPHRTTPLRYYRGADLLKPNRDEAFILAGLVQEELHLKADFIKELGESLLTQAEVKNLVITRGKEGMTLFSQGPMNHLPTYARQVFDVTGAGDTVTAALTLAWVSGLSLEESCVFANFAAGVVVGQVGCVPCSRQELLSYMDQEVFHNL